MKGPTWSPLLVSWATLVPAWAPVALPGRFVMPDQPWAYGAVSGVLEPPGEGSWAIQIQVSDVTAALALSMADQDGQGAKRFLRLQPSVAQYLISAVIPPVPDTAGRRLIIQNLGQSEGAVTVHAAWIARIDDLDFDQWRKFWENTCALQASNAPS